MFKLSWFSQPAPLRHIIMAAVFIGAAPICGWILQRLIIRRLKKRATITQWGGDHIVVAAIRDIVILWALIAGGFGALAVLPIKPGLEHTLTKLLSAGLIVSGTILLARLVSDVIRLFSLRRSRTMRSSSIFVNLARIIIGILGLLVLLQTLGVSITPLLTALGVGGLAVALALQDTLSNFFAGLQIIATKRVKPGDFVKLETGEEGYVEDIDWRHTSIRQLKNNMVLVPNSKLVNSILLNYYYPHKELSVTIDVGVSYSNDLDHVERVTLQVARETVRDIEAGITDFEPFIRYHTLNSYSVDFSVVMRVREYTDQFLLKHEFLKRLKARYERENISIPFPTIDWAEDHSPFETRQRQRRRA
jgi:small-conductance mechanosensitive channel